MESTDARQPGYCGGVSCLEPITKALAALSGKWSIAIIEALHFAGAALRFGELQRSIPGISPKELARHLAMLAERGVLERAPAPAGAYILSARGQALLQHIDALGQWAKDNGCPEERGEQATWMGPLRPLSRW